MVAVDSPYICVGLNLDSTPFQENDPLVDLEQKIADSNAHITGRFATVVLLENMTPNSYVDTDSIAEARRDIKGAFTAVQMENEKPGMKIKLLLANPGSSSAGSYWPKAVEAIKKAQPVEHIVAVTGIGVSMNQTRQAVAGLGKGDPSIAVVGALVTADNMNLDLNGRPLQNFFRVAPTNSDEVSAAATYIGKGYRRILLIEDTNPDDSYARTLAAAFDRLKDINASYTRTYRSPAGRVADASRQGLVGGLFTSWTGSICAMKPDLIYFAGRGVDLEAFLKAMSNDQCKMDPATVVTGDDANNLVGHRPAYSSFVDEVVYTGLAARDQWPAQPQYGIQRDVYRDFVTAFKENGFREDDLDDGNAMMNYDAMLVAITAARMNDATKDNPGAMASYLQALTCNNSVHGVSGDISLGVDGNPSNKPMPIIRIRDDGTHETVEIAGPETPACQGS
jgi:hypothetical protein